jgi:ABC-2 type transport system permease protein
MHKILLIAKRDYLQIVLSKAYLIGLVFFPLIFGGGPLAISLLSRSNAREQRVAVVDRTGAAAAAVIDAIAESNRRAIADSSNALQVVPRYSVEEVKPEADEAAQSLALSDRIRRGELFLVIDIPRDAVQPGDLKGDPIRYYTNSSAPGALSLRLPAAVNDGLRRVRLAQLGVEPRHGAEILRQVPVVSVGLTTRDPATGKAVTGEKASPLQTVAVPFFLVILLVMVVMVGAAPRLGSVAEDKTQRVFEMLLSSATPFELMAGKVVAALGASLTSSVLYVVGALMALLAMAMFGVAPLHLLPWFFAYLIADVVMLSALAVALGSACSSAQDAQQLALLLFLPIMIPMLMLNPVMQQPNGAFSTAMSFIPPFTPVVMLLRQALPGGVPWWQPWLGLLGVTLWAFAVIWAASRIFRIGILSQGKTPKVAELVQWVLRG